MKKRLKELDVDFIGGQGPLTKDEALSISAFIRKNKEKHNKKQLHYKPKARKKIQQPV